MTCTLENVFFLEIQSDCPCKIPLPWLQLRQLWARTLVLCRMWSAPGDTGHLSRYFKTTQMGWLDLAKGFVEINHSRSEFAGTWVLLVKEMALVLFGSKITEGRPRSGLVYIGEVKHFETYPDSTGKTGGWRLVLPFRGFIFGGYVSFNFILQFDPNFDSLVF